MNTTITGGCCTLYKLKDDFHLAPGCANKSLTKAISVFIFLSKLHHNFVLVCMILQNKGFLWLRFHSPNWRLHVVGDLPVQTSLLQPAQPDLCQGIGQTQLSFSQLGAQFSARLYKIRCNQPNLTYAMELDGRNLEYNFLVQWGFINKLYLTYAMKLDRHDYQLGAHFQEIMRLYKLGCNLTCAMEMARCKVEHSSLIEWG